MDVLALPSIPLSVTKPDPTTLSPSFGCCAIVELFGISAAFLPTLETRGCFSAVKLQVLHSGQWPQQRFQSNLFWLCAESHSGILPHFNFWWILDQQKSLKLTLSVAKPCLLGIQLLAALAPVGVCITAWASIPWLPVLGQQWRGEQTLG